MRAGPKAQVTAPRRGRVQGGVGGRNCSCSTLDVGINPGRQLCCRGTDHEENGVHGPEWPARQLERLRPGCSCSSLTSQPPRCHAA